MTMQMEVRPWATNRVSTYSSTVICKSLLCYTRCYYSWKFSTTSSIKISKRGTSFSSLYWQSTQTASKAVLNLFMECRNVVFRTANSLIRPLNVSWRKSALRLNIFTPRLSCALYVLTSAGDPVYPLSPIAFFPLSCSSLRNPFFFEN